MHRFLKIFQSFIFLTVISSVVHAQNDVDFMNVKLFETGHDAVPQSERYYTTHFSKSTSKYIFYEAEVRNNLYNIKSNSLKLYAEFYGPDGTLMGDPVLEYTIPSDWATAYLWHGWGWNESGNWDAGRYRLVLYINHEKLTEIYFTIEDDDWDY
jgi:hypothetical protein